ncbi:MAG: hypothetical protein LBC70_04570 [Chitinispirillales bacterium]|jgi:tRNA U34 2-thiouridine synthase MnmA/TrmU|nr:hypothetical protein [Chitinispirillales bacterium]
MSTTNHKAVVMFSGGLDSVIAVHLLKSQGLDVTALHFVLPFYSGLGQTPREAEEHARALGVPLRVEEEGAEFMEMIRDPKFGYGKGANPCIDCRIHRLGKAAKIAEEEGAVCLATGEVAGQRPMSQKMPTLHRIEKAAGLRGKLLRPLSAKLLPPTDVELAGIVDREKLLGISGRSRTVQLAYAKQYGLIHSSPAGGCLLTNVETGARFDDLSGHNPQFSLLDFKLLAYGRHFRTSPDYRVVISRDAEETGILDKLYSQASALPTPAPTVIKFHLRDALGPVALGIGVPGEADLQFSAAAVVRFSRLRDAERAAVVITGGGLERVLEAETAEESALNKYRVCHR